MNNKQREMLDKAVDFTNTLNGCTELYEPVRIDTYDMTDGDCHVQLIYEGIASTLLDKCYSFVIGKRGGMFRYGKGAKREYLTLGDLNRKARIY